MRANHDLIVAVIDKSGSMHAKASDAIGGFNKFLDDQRALPGRTAEMTLLFFDTVVQVVHEHMAIEEVPPLDADTYRPGGNTALLDAVGKAVDDAGRYMEGLAESERPEKVVVAILTDGEENSSKVFSKEQVAEKIAHQTEVYGWGFVFLAADEKQWAEGRGLGIRSSVNYQGDTQSGYQTMSSGVARHRTGTGG